MTDQAPPTRADRSLSLLEQLLAATKETNRLLKRLVPPEIASDAQLDDPKHGDPIVNFTKAWKGQFFKGKRFSQCPSDYLDHLAWTFDFYAEKKRAEGDTKKAGYDEVEAARARGWARRLRSGWKPAGASDVVEPHDAAEPDDEWAPMETDT